MCISQNKNVNGRHTSDSNVRDLCRPDRCTAMKMLLKKTFKFVDLLWAMYVTINKDDIKYVGVIHDCNCALVLTESYPCLSVLQLRLWEQRGMEMITSSLMDSYGCSAQRTKQMMIFPTKDIHIQACIIL